MSHFLIRFNKTAGQPGRGSSEHVWRVFEDGREHLARHVKILVPSYSEQDGPDWNIACDGKLMYYADTDTAVIMPS